VTNKIGSIDANFIAPIIALFLLIAPSTQAKDNTQALGTIHCDGGIRGIATHIQSPQGFEPNQSVILTAAHVLYNSQTGQLFDQCHYRPQNKRLSGISFETLSSHSYSVKNKDKIAQAESDIVFIQLKKAAHQPRLKLAQDFSNVASEFSLISPDLDGFIQTRCNKIDHPHLNSDKLLLHDCSVQLGSSGSPLLNARGDVIAIHGGRFTVQTAKNGEENTEWIGQARRIDSKIDIDLGR
jgi:V8-like Glu-specific endopeptidase